MTTVAADKLALVLGWHYLRNDHKMTAAGVLTTMTLSNTEETTLYFRRSPLVATLGGLVAYLMLDYVSFLESFRGMAITPWSPGSGLALALVLLIGLRTAGVVLVAPPLAGILVRSDTVPTAIHLIEGITLGGSYLLIGQLARHYGRIDPRLQTVRDVLVLMSTALAAAAMAAFCYVGVLRIADFLTAEETLEAFGRFLVGDLIGMLIVTPTILLAVSGRLPKRPTVESFAVLATIPLALATIFLLPHANELQLFYLLFVPLIWSALRGGIAGVAITLCVIQIALILTIRAPFTLASSIVPYQILMIWLASSGLIFGVLVAQQRAATARLHYQQLALGRALRFRAMGEIAAGIAHEVNQPLTSIKTLAGVLRRELTKQSTDTCQEVAEKIRSECDRASRIIRATREALRQQLTRIEPIDAAALISELEDLVADRLAALDVRLVKYVDTAAQTVVGDRTQISQALFNLIDNSLIAIEEGGKPGVVTVRVVPASAGEIAFEVLDTGPGFPAGVGDGSGLPPMVSTRPLGSGVGLAIVRSVAESHGGRLTIATRHGRTCVRFTITKES